MTINRGDLITATALNDINRSITKTYAHGHADWTYIEQNYYFYSNRAPASNLVHYTSKRTAGCNHQVNLYRRENGEWVWKDGQHASGGIKEWYKGVGPGMYRCKLYYHNNTPTTKIYPVKDNCVRGNYLRMMDRGPTGLTESELLSIDPRCHKTIYASDINAGRVYTD